MCLASECRAPPTVQSPRARKKASAPEDVLLEVLLERQTTNGLDDEREPVDARAVRESLARLAAGPCAWPGARQTGTARSRNAAWSRPSTHAKRGIRARSLCGKRQAHQAGQMWRTGQSRQRETEAHPLAAAGIRRRRDTQLLRDFARMRVEEPVGEPWRAQRAVWSGARGREKKRRWRRKRTGRVRRQHLDGDGRRVVLEHDLVLVVEALEELDRLELRDVLTRVVVERESALLDQLQRRDGPDELRRRVELMDRVACERDALCFELSRVVRQLRPPAKPAVDLAVSSRCDHGHAREARVGIRRGIANCGIDSRGGGEHIC